LTPRRFACPKASVHRLDRAYPLFPSCSQVDCGCSAIVGTKDFIARARWFRKAFGGGVRQSGGMAAAADYAITNHFPRLASTHALARRLAEGLEGLGCHILAQVDTNMVRLHSPFPVSVAGLTVWGMTGLLRPQPTRSHSGLRHGPPESPPETHHPNARADRRAPPDLAAGRRGLDRYGQGNER